MTSQSESIILLIFWKQHLLGRSCEMRLKFNIQPPEDNCEVELQVWYENENGNNVHHYLIEKEMNIEESLQLVENLCTQPWYDFVDDNGSITINETEYESLRLRGKHTGQKIYMYEFINHLFGLKRTLLNVQRM